MLRALEVLTALMLTAAIGGAQQQADTDGDSITDSVEQQIGTDPANPETLELIADDGMGAADTSRKSACIPAGDYGKVWFAPVARGRYLWKIEMAEQVIWPQEPYEVRILYIDADNDPATGRPDNGPGCDIMLYPDRANRLIEWPEAVRSIAVAHGNAWKILVEDHPGSETTDLLRARVQRMIGCHLHGWVSGFAGSRDIEPGDGVPVVILALSCVLVEQLHAED